jgi:hypothetical protein
LPGSLRDLHGAAFVEAASEALAHDDFTGTLLGDPKWVEMRGRWVRLGWHDTTDATFNDAFVRAVVERVATIHDARGEDAVQSGLTIQDTVLDDQLERVRPEMREHMIRAFKERLDREYAALPVNRDVTVTLDGEDARQLRRVADRWGTTPSGAAERIAHEALVHEATRLTAEDARRSAALDVVGDFLQATDTPNQPTAYSDHDLMRRGRIVWEASYADGMTDEGLRDAIGRLNVGSPYPDDIVLFSAKWAVHAFQRLMTSHTFAAALMCSDVQREVLAGIEEQWDAFLVIVPNGMLIAGELEFSRVLVATYSFGARMILLTTGGPNLNLRVGLAGCVTDEAPTLADLLVSDGTDLHEDAVTRRCLIMAKRLVAGLLLNLQDAGTHKIRKVEARSKGKGREAAPEHRIVTVGAPIEIDCRDAVKEYIERGTRSSEKTGRQHRGAPTVQWMVRGHYRMQACGPQHTLRRKTWIRPFWKGNEAALIQTRARMHT